MIVSTAEVNDINKRVHTHARYNRKKQQKKYEIRSSSSWTKSKIENVFSPPYFFKYKIYQTHFAYEISCIIINVLYDFLGRSDGTEDRERKNVELYNYYYCSNSNNYRSCPESEPDDHNIASARESSGNTYGRSGPTVMVGSVGWVSRVSCYTVK